MIDMYGQEVGVGCTVLTWVKEGNGIELKHVVVTKVNPKTIEFTYDYVPTAKYYSPSTNSIVEVLKIDVGTNNVFIRNSKLIDGWYEMDGWVHVKHLSEFEVNNEH